MHSFVLLAFNSGSICVFARSCSLFTLIAGCYSTVRTYAVRPFPCDGLSGVASFGLLFIAGTLTHIFWLILFPCTFMFRVQEVDIFRPKLEDIALLAKNCVLGHLATARQTGESSIVPGREKEERGRGEEERAGKFCGARGVNACTLLFLAGMSLSLYSSQPSGNDTMWNFL